VRISPRRARLLARSLLAATIVAERPRRALFRSVLECSLPHPTWGADGRARGGGGGAPAGVGGVPRPGGRAGSTRSSPSQPLSRKLELLLDALPDPDAGSQAVAQLIATPSPDRAAAFAFAVYPAAALGRLPIGAEGVNDLAKIAVPLMDAEGEIAWQERLSEQGTSHPVIAQIARCSRRCATAASRGHGSS
jgi:MoxR-like ATPase